MIRDARRGNQPRKEEQLLTVELKELGVERGCHGLVVGVVLHGVGLVSEIRESRKAENARRLPDKGVPAPLRPLCVSWGRRSVVGG